jgi:SAM-dependent methyltransferase
MASKQNDVVKREFAKQAGGFGQKGLTLARADYLSWMVGNLGLAPELTVLDVAAGTGHLSRAMAPHVAHVTAFDLTPEMLAQARAAAQGEGLANIAFAEGNAERLPFGDGSFDRVVTRFAVHHFADPRVQVGEMARVCAAGGRVAVIDMVAPGDPVLAESYNRLERLRDPSHTWAFAPPDLIALVAGAGLSPVQTESREIEVNAGNWFDLTKTPAPTRVRILREMSGEIGGGGETGMRPFRRDGEIFFMQTWLIVVGAKAEG